MKRLDTLMPWIIGPSILDVGCTGSAVTPTESYWLHGQLRERFDDVWGVDIASDRIEQMRQLGFDNLHVADAQDFSLPKRFDTVVAGEVIEHLENPGRFLRCALEHLNPSGRIVLTTPYPFGLTHSFYALVKFPKTCANPEHTVWICPATMQELAARSGLSTTHWELLKAAHVPSGSRAFDLIVRLSRFLPRRIGASNALYVFEAR